MECLYCGSDVLDYLGVDEGGDYADSLCDSWVCLECGMNFETNCIESAADDESMQTLRLDHLPGIGYATTGDADDLDEIPW